jgi:hypothetical protein
MKGILADINVGKQRRVILTIWGSHSWRDIWKALELSVVSFPALGLSYDASDALIWRTCQRVMRIDEVGGTGRLYVP